MCETRIKCCRCKELFDPHDGHKCKLSSRDELKREALAVDVFSNEDSADEKEKRVRHSFVR